MNRTVEIVILETLEHRGPLTAKQICAFARRDARERNLGPHYSGSIPFCLPMLGDNTGWVYKERRKGYAPSRNGLVYLYSITEEGKEKLRRWREEGEHARHVIDKSAVIV